MKITCIEDIQKILGRAADRAVDDDRPDLVKEFEACEKFIADELGLTWTLGDNVAKAAVALLECGVYIPEPPAEPLMKALAEWDAQKPRPRAIERELAEALENHLPFVPDMEPTGAAQYSAANQAAWKLREVFAKWKEGQP